MRYYCFFDGGCIHNGSQSARTYGSCAVYQVPSDLKHPLIVGAEFFQCAKPTIFDSRISLSPLSRPGTNNTAEAQALQYLLVRTYSKGILRPENHLTVFGDSELIIFQVQKIYKTNNPALQKIYGEIYTLFKIYRKKYRSNIGSVLKFDLISGDLMKLIIGH